jgi:hypothetical protein
VLYVVRYRSLRRADHSSRGVIPSVVCPNECDRETSKKQANPHPRMQLPLEEFIYLYVVPFRSQATVLSIVTKLRAGRSGVRTPAGERDFSFRTAVGTIKRSIRWVPGFFPESKAAGA